MKFVYTKHALEDKLPELKRLEWNIAKRKVERTIHNPKWRGVSRHGQKTAMSLVDDKHILRVIFNRENGTIKIMTFHIARRGNMRVRYDKDEDILMIEFIKKRLMIPMKLKIVL